MQGNYRNNRRIITPVEDEGAGVTHNDKLHNHFNLKVIRGDEVTQDVTVYNTVYPYVLKYLRIGDSFAYPSYLAYGRGTSPTNLDSPGLVSRIGTASRLSSNTECIRKDVWAYTMTFRIGLTAAVGEDISELSLYEGNTLYFNRVLITDAYGNVTPIHKTDLDIIDITVTLYYVNSITDPWTYMADGRSLPRLEYRLDLFTAYYYEYTQVNGSYTSSTDSSWTKTARLTPDKDMYYCYGIMLSKIGSCSKYMFDSPPIYDYPYAVGDGTSTMFTNSSFIPHVDGNLYADGKLIPKTEYRMNALRWRILLTGPVLCFSQVNGHNACPISVTYTTTQNSISYRFSSRAYAQVGPDNILDYTVYRPKCVPTDIFVDTITHSVRKQAELELTISAGESVDNMRIIRHDTITTKGAETHIECYKGDPIPDSFVHVRLVAKGQSGVFGEGDSAKYGNSNDNNDFLTSSGLYTQIVFNNPPANGAIITYTGPTNSIPHSENYVTDLSYGASVGILS